jgi:hypothetical protein
MPKESDTRMSRNRLILSLVAAGVLVAGSPISGDAQTWRSVTMSRQLGEEEELDVRVRFGAGRLSIKAGEEGTLYRMHLRYDEEAFSPVADHEGSSLALGVEAVKNNIHWGKKDGQEMELFLAKSVPMKLDLEFGAVRANLDLGGLEMTELELSTGASESRVDFSQPNPVRMSRADFQVGAADLQLRTLGNLNADQINVDAGVGHVVLDFQGEWQGDSEVTVDIGLGALELRFPEGLGVSLEKDTFLTSLDSQGLVKRGDTYRSVDWDKAAHKVTVKVDAAFGSIDVVWVR